MAKTTNSIANNHTNKFQTPLVTAQTKPPKKTHQTNQNPCKRNLFLTSSQLSPIKHKKKIPYLSTHSDSITTWPLIRLRRQTIPTKVWEGGSNWEEKLVLEHCYSFQIEKRRQTINLIFLEEWIWTYQFSNKHPHTDV